ncbi:hypothetical protein NC653_009501 [Populus alba x Populus x berolinensis]|uniref:Uncharacterized protein n=1 Tax=Populus alba x Populus x berolinensis TaxID=444605 RepID=A0AAD6RAC7_9ROSI|nr:hypothetical protein NC653_009501 [Populus alba x Populus x berolinensis]
MTQRALAQLYLPASGIINWFLPSSHILNSQSKDVVGYFARSNLCLLNRLMEDPKERDRKFRERVYAVKDRCQKTKEMWSYPLRPYGFWTFERHNAQLAWDAKISQVPGRRDPYDDLLQDSYGFPK